MTENVNYKRCVCDRCGKEERISTSVILPEGWLHIEKLGFLNSVDWDFCKNCRDAINEMILNDIEKHNEKIHLGSGK